MFTGLIEEIGKVKSLRNVGEGYELTVEAKIVNGDVKIGDSIAINGACQTVTSFSSNFFSVFVSKITAKITSLGSFLPGEYVNLERAMTPMSRFGGHIVQGHVDGMGQILRINRDISGIEVIIKLDPKVMKYVVSKGSITVDGISLTVVLAEDDTFSLYLIPETLEKTNISSWKPSSKVNIEVDILSKYVEKMLLNQDEVSSNKSSIKNSLYEAGFM